MRPVDAQLERAVAEAIAWGDRHDVFLLNPMASEARAFWLEGGRKPWVARLILSSVEAMRPVVAVGQRPAFASPPGWPDGVIGGLSTWDGQLVRLPLRPFASGVVFVGESGSGKTTLMLQQAADLARQGVGVVLVETSKRHELRVLRRLVAPEGIECAVVPADELRFNPFDPEGVAVAPFAAFMQDVLTFALELRDLGAIINHHLLVEEYARRGVAGPGGPPVALDLWAAWLQASRNALATESARERWRRFLTACPDGVRRVRQGTPLEALVGPGRCCVLELDAVPESVQTVVVLSLLFKQFRRGVERPAAAEAPLTHFVWLDDAGRFLKRKPAVEVQPLDSLVTVTRAEGVAVGVALHTLEDVSRRLLSGLVGVKVLFATGTAEDARLVAAAMGQSATQLEWVKQSLVPGLAVVQAQVGHRAPWVARVQPLDRPAVSDAEVAESLGRLRAWPVVWATEYPADVLAWLRPATGVSRTASPASSQPVALRGAPSADTLDAADLRYLAAVDRTPGKPSSYYAKAAGLKSGPAKQTRERLVALGHLEAEVVATDVSGRPPILVKLTPQGRAALERAAPEAG